MAKRKSGTAVKQRAAPTELPIFPDPALVELAIEAQADEETRPRDSRGEPGGLIELPQDKKLVIVGDLHACCANLDFILAHSGVLEAVRRDEARLLFLGDALHDDRTGHMREMANSIQIIERILGIIAADPGRVFYIRGNHDTFDERLRKSGVAQGALFRQALEAEKGPGIAEAVGRWFESLPYAAIGEKLFIVHAGPVRGGCTREEIVEAWRRPDYVTQFIWNRVNEFHGTSSPKEYSGKDIEASFFQLEMPPDSTFLVGHNPLWNDGGRTGFWKDVIGIKNHHILYSGAGSLAPYAVAERGAFSVEFSKPKEQEAFYYG